MEICLGVIRIIICIISGYVIFKFFESRDTSAFETLILKNKDLINKIFSPKDLSDIEISFKKLTIPYNTFSVLAIVGIGIMVSIIAFWCCNLIFPLKTISVIVSFPLILSPFWVIKYIANKEHENLENGLNDFFIQLKSALRVNSDIIEALRRIQNITIEPFRRYTWQLLTEINAGKLPEKALESFANKINIKKFTFYINNVRYCQIYGGDVMTLTEKTQNTLSEALKEKKKRIKETKSVCAVLYILIAIDFYMYFSFIQSNDYYLNIMTNSFIGQSILNFNFLSIWGIVWLSRVARKFDY